MHVIVYLYLVITYLGYGDCGVGSIIIIIDSKRGVFYTYIHESGTQDAPALRTRDGGLKIFYDRSTLPAHPVPQTLMHKRLATHC